jgi:predicted dehydrogenase
MGQPKTTVTLELGYAKTPLEPSARECFPQTLAFLEGPRGSIELAADYLIRITTAKGTQITRHEPRRYAWANPAYDVAHAAIVDCHANLLAALQGKGAAETTGEDNLKTIELVFAAYESARTGKVVRL